jgi:NADPH:quinone reductase-like Zn-dependent oxidoreductase
MTDRRFEYVRAAKGFDIKQVPAERPVAGAGEVVMRVHATSVNRRDVMIQRDQGYPTGDANHFVPMSDAAGVIVEVGAAVVGVKTGDQVTSTFFQNWSDGRITFPAVISALGAGGRGVLADHIVLSAGGVAPMPKGWSFVQAATIPCAAVTAWSALMTHGKLQANDWVLIIGTGGVALYGLQIAVAAGAKVAIISSSDEKLARCRELGATVTINYAKTPDWNVAVREVTGGVQQVIELGGAGTLAKSVSSLGIGGHLALIGGLAGFGGELSAASLVMAALRATAIAVGSRAEHLALIEFLTRHQLKPVIEQVFELNALHDAYDRADTGAFGKVVVRVNG